MIACTEPCLAGVDDGSRDGEGRSCLPKVGSV